MQERLLRRSATAAWKELMTRPGWADLPAPVRAAIEHRCGRVIRAQVASGGRNADFSATLHMADGRVFCKGTADANGPRGRAQRHEAYINPWLPPVAPRLAWVSEVAEWLLLGFEHVGGRHADLSPGSPGLALVADAMATTSDALAHCTARAPGLADKWRWLSGWKRLAAMPDYLDVWPRDRLDQLLKWEAKGIEWADGDGLVHTDLHPLNILVGEGRAWIVDWAWSRKGDAATDAALLVIRLIHAGHTPESAEAWAGLLPAWRATSEPKLTAFAVSIWGAWEYLQRTDPLPHRAALTSAAQRWAKYRLGSSAG
ncbi:phosphotransferase [Amycolatopsis pigmentata]|uniref:Phosphotransferase n=1 Tax=Amycolatopsis pigmentata TaxID=450801 RepID=A0ABW5FTL0_9PSEU